jgi:RNA polymerase sigma-70 factor (ECF subfamily)
VRIDREALEQKFITVYETHVDEIYQFIYLRTGLRKDIAEDLTQEIFLEVYRGLSGFRGLCSQRTWIFRIARNKLNDFYRKQYQQKLEFIDIDTSEAEELYNLEQDILEDIVEAFERDKVHRTLELLPQQYQLALVLKYIDEKSVKEIAVMIGKSPKAAESILQRAKHSFIKSYRKLEGEGKE